MTYNARLQRLAWRLALRRDHVLHHAKLFIVMLQLLDSKTKSVLLRGTAVEDYTRQVNPRLLMKAQQYHPTALPTETALAMLL